MKRQKLTRKKFFQIEWDRNAEAMKWGPPDVEMTH
jgi:hypothetical protein